MFGFLSVKGVMNSCGWYDQSLGLSKYKKLYCRAISPAKTHTLYLLQSNWGGGGRFGWGHRWKHGGLRSDRSHWSVSTSTCPFPNATSIHGHNCKSFMFWNEHSGHHHGCRVILIRVLFLCFVFFQKPIGWRLTGCPVPIGSSRTHFLYDHLRRSTMRDQWLLSFLIVVVASVPWFHCFGIRVLSLAC